MMVVVVVDCCGKWWLIAAAVADTNTHSYKDRHKLQLIVFGDRNHIC